MTEFSDSDLYKIFEGSEKVGSAAFERAATLSQAENIRIDRALLRLGLLEETELLKTIADHFDLPFIEDPSRAVVDDQCVEILGTDYLNLNTIVPIESDQGNCTLLTADPLNRAVVEEASFCLDQTVRILVSHSHGIRRVIESFGTDSDGHDRGTSAQRSARDRTLFQEGEIEGPVIKFVGETLSDAVARGASDVHFASTTDHVSVRFRLNGLLAHQPVAQNLNPASIFARIKLLAGLNVAERRRPQDGRLTTIIGGRVIDFRVSSVPTQHGESVVCRILDPNALRLGWDKLGFDNSTSEAIRRITRSNNGLFLVTGPTGSGKTTTLYTALSDLKSESRKIITIEDPIEYDLSGTEQIQINDAAGLTFANALESVLRQDPNVVMVGEIRNAETAEMACRTALIGRMVLSTLHTSSADAAVTRLVDLGVDRFIVDDVLRGVLAQELRVIPCDGCAGSSCARCGGSGSLGRRLVTQLIDCT